MDNLINYVKENGYKTFNELKFNEVDAAIYCILSYINFDGIKIKNIKIKASDTKTTSSLIMKKKSTKLLNFKH